MSPTSGWSDTTETDLVAADSTGLAAAPAAAFAAASSGPADGSVSKVMIGEPTSTVYAGLVVDLGHDAGERRRHLDGGLGGLDLDDDLVELDGVADGDHPLQDLALGEALAEVGQLEVLEPAQPTRARHQKASERSTACSTRSRSGRYSSSTRDGGYGVS